MSNFFNMDNAFFTFLGKVCDVLFLSLIWIVFCIPIITIGPANTALYYACVKVIRRERGYVFREFFKSFKLNFKRGAIIGVILTAILVVLSLDIFAARAAFNGSSSVNSIMFGIYLALAIFVISIAIYIFPLLSRFDMSVKQLFKASAFMSLRHFIPYTIGILVLLALAVLGVFFIPILIFIIPAGVTVCYSLLMEKVLKKYMPTDENADEDTSKDQWYLE
jgi:Predicted integral membrane protein